MKLVYFHPEVRLSSHYFWYPEFQKQCNKILWIKNINWTIKQITNFKPNHIHFGSRVIPRKKWIPIEKLKKLKQLLPKTVITTHRAGINGISYLEELNALVDGAFGSTDSIKNQQWMGEPSEPNFWRCKKRNIKYKIIFIGRSYLYRKLRNERNYRLKELIANGFPVTIVGDNNWRKYGIHNLLQTRSFIETKNYYCKSLIGLNIISNLYSNYRKAFSNRLTHMMMNGLMCFTPYQPGLEEIFENEKHCIFYHNTEELIKKLTYYLKIENRSKLDQIAKAGQQFAIKNFNIRDAVKRVLEVKKRI